MDKSAIVWYNAYKGVSKNIPECHRIIIERHNIGKTNQYMQLNIKERIQNMKLQEKYRLSFDGQVNAAINNECPYTVFETDHNIDAEIFEGAVNKAIEYHPVFKMKLKKEKGLYYLIPNNAPAKIAVSDWKTDITYGTPEYNGYPWLITIGGKRIVFSCAHCLCDGMGVLSFLKTVIAIYLADKGLVSKDRKFAVSEDDILRTLEDSFEKNAKSGIKPPYNIRKAKKASSIPKKIFEKDKEKTALRRIKIHKDELKKLTEQTETTTFSVISSILAKSLAKALKKEDGNITIILPVNMRGMYDSVTDRGFAYSAKLNYDIAKCIGKPLYFSSTAFRSQLDTIIDKDYFDYILSENKKQTDMLFKYPILLNLAKSAFYGMLYSPKASIVYTHLTKLGLDADIEAHIEDVYISGAAKPGPLIVAMACTFRDEISITIGQSIKDDALIKSIKTVLDELNVRYEFTKPEKMPAIHCAF